MKLGWYWHRLGRMGPGEIVWRTRDTALKLVWRYRYGNRPLLAPIPPRIYQRAFVSPLPAFDRAALPQSAVDRLLATAQGILEGHWKVFSRQHPDLGEHPDWFVDARSGRRTPADRYAFDIPYRNADEIGDIKFIWEPSRHHHLTILAAAYAATGDERYAKRVAVHLQSWWSDNQFMFGPHWISGIELGIRLISWVWVRRLLHRWRDVKALFDENPQFLNQLYYHQKWLDAFPSRGSSANNHLIAEAAGQFITACAFPIFRESRRWRDQSARVLRREILSQTFASGLNRELATGYHGLVLELFLGAAIEGELVGYSLGENFWERIRAMTDALAAIIDATGCPPRQGDCDDGSGLLLDSPDYDRWKALLATGRRLFSAPPWWPQFGVEDLRTHLWTRDLEVPALLQARPPRRPHLFADAGQIYLRAGQGPDEIWCRGDVGPHGFSSIAAHAHADALSIEFRVGGTQILVDPGTYCYHSDSKWRTYFRSTLGHNTLEMGSQDQSVSGGPFMWIQHAQSTLLAVRGLDETLGQAQWQAEHRGYDKQSNGIHRRTVTLNRTARVLTIRDEISTRAIGPIPVRLAFHLGPEVSCRLDVGRARLWWQGGSAKFELPVELSWTLHRGQDDPILGWFSPSFDVKVPSYSLLGTGILKDEYPIVSRLTTLPSRLST